MLKAFTAGCGSSGSVSNKNSKQKMFLRRIDYVKYIEKKRFLVNEVFPY
jgi:hypothetical protein